MTGELREQGKRLLGESERILRRDASGALADRDFNLAIRRAQEVVELALKGGLNLMCTEYQRTHDVAPVFCERVQEKIGDVAEPLERIREVSTWLSQARGPALYLEQDYSADDAEQACDDARFVLEAVGRLVGD